MPALQTWTGAAGDNLWSNPLNWSGGRLMGGDAVAFTGNTTSINDLSDLAVARISFSGTSNTITRREPLFFLSTENIFSSGGTHTITGTSIANTLASLSVTAGTGSTVVISSAIVGNRGLVKFGDGTLSLRGVQNYVGTTRINGGTLEVPAGGNLVTTPVALDGGSTLTGGGRVLLVSATANGGRITPGLGTSTQALTISNSFLGNLTYLPTITGANSDQVKVVGLIDLTNGSLSPIPISAPTASSYVLIDNDGTDAITGTFNGLPEGALLLVAGQTYAISYAGGDGNDVVLTRVGGPPAPPSALPAPPAPAPAFSGAQVVGGALVISGASVPNGIQAVPLPAGSLALFADLTGDGAGDVILFLPTLALVLDGQTGRLVLLDTDDDGDGARDLKIFDPDGSAVRIDGRTGMVRVF